MQVGWGVEVALKQLSDRSKLSVASSKRPLLRLAQLDEKALPLVVEFVLVVTLTLCGACLATAFEVRVSALAPRLVVSHYA